VSRSQCLSAFGGFIRQERAPPKDIFQVDDDSATPNADATIIDQDYPVETYI